LKIKEILASVIEGTADAFHDLSGELYAGSPSTIPERRKEIRIQQGHKADNGNRSHIAEHRQSGDEIEAGGVGSGCNPEVADHCGPLPKVPQHITSIRLKLQDKDWTASKKALKQQQKYDKYAATGKYIFGVWKPDSGGALLYKTLMTGEWNKVSDLSSKLLAINEDPEYQIAKFARVGKRLTQFDVQVSPDGTSVRMSWKQVQDQAKGQVGVTTDMQHAAQQAVQKLITNTGLDKTISTKVLGEYLSQIGLKNVDLLKDCVSGWTGAPTGARPMYLKRVAADYYGNKWSDEYKGEKAHDPSNFKYNELKEQALAIKALSNEYMKAKGIQYLYRGMGLSSDKLKEINNAVTSGKAAEIPINSLTGFSISKSVSVGTFMNGVAFRVKVNPEDVWVASGALPQLFGGYAKDEKEYIVGSKTNKTLVVEPDDVVTYYHTPAWTKDPSSMYAAEEPSYPNTHKAGMRVPKGGSSCESCKFLEDGNKCNNKYFIEWNGSKDLPLPADEYCSDWYEPNKELKAAQEVSLEGDQKGSLWNGIKITGFTGPEEEGLRAMLSRIPSELFFNVHEFKSAKELKAKHGKYEPETKTISFNPSNFILRQRFGKGDGWIYHPELTAIHEVGHSIYHSFTPEQVKTWENISGWIEGWKPGQSLAYQEKRPGWGNAKSNWTHKTGIKFTRHYAERNPGEDFADCFAFVILNKGHQMEPSKKAFIDSYIKDTVKRYPQVNIQSPSSPYPPVINKAELNLYNITSGGVGSGCHGPNCGRPSKDNYLEKKIGDAQGTNKGGFYKGADGKERYIKFYKDPVQGKCEVLANEIYKDLGIGAPKSEVFETATGEAFGSEIIPASKELNSVKVTPELAGRIMEGFAADVLTANWDAVGLEKDNIRVKNGEPYRVDNGGSFLFRAQAGRKPDHLLTNPTEVKGFFDPSINHAYLSVAKAAGYKNHTEMGHELERQVSKISALESKSGGWDKYVKDKVPTLTGTDRGKVVGMLVSRTSALKKLAGINASVDKHVLALDSYVPQTKKKSQAAIAADNLVAKYVGGKVLGDGGPFDVMKGKTGIEVKAIFVTAHNEKLTMHPASLIRKFKAQKKLGLDKVYTVAIDVRKKPLTVYVKEGLGSFRLGSMQKLNSVKELSSVIQ
jgi:hypothetical protein